MIMQIRYLGENDAGEKIMDLFAAKKERWNRIRDHKLQVMIHARGNIYEGDAELGDKVEDGSIIKDLEGDLGVRKVVTKINCQTVKEVMFCRAINGQRKLLINLYKT